MLNHFHKLYAYNAWANRETLGSLRRLQPLPAPALKYFCHVLAAERLWHTRLSRQSTEGFVVAPQWTVEQCATVTGELQKLWENFLQGITTEMLLHSVTYTNTEGETWRNTVADILEHVVLHSGYHRGQVATAIRAAGGEPAYTDYIHAVRRGLIPTRVPGSPAH